MDSRLYAVWLSLAITPGTESFRKLLDKFSSPEEIYNADDSRIASCIGSKSRDYSSLIDKDTGKAERILDFCISRNVGILTYFDKDFPISLKIMWDDGVPHLQQNFFNYVSLQLNVSEFRGSRARSSLGPAWFIG